MNDRKLPSRQVKVLALSLGRTMAGVSSLVVFAILSRAFDKTDYAAFRQTVLAYMIVAPFLTVGLNQGIYYFLPEEKHRIRGRIVDVLLVLLISSLSFAAFVGLGGNELIAARFSNPAVAKLLLFLIPFVFANVVIQIVDPIMTTQNRVVELSVFSVFSRILAGVLTVVPLVLWTTPAAAIHGKVIGSLLAAGVGLWLIWKMLPKDDWRPSLASIWEMTKFSLPLGFASMVGVMNVQLDKFVVSSMLPPEEFAVFTNGAVEIPLIGILTGSIVTVLMVDMRQAILEGRSEDALSLFRKTAYKSSIVLFPVAIYLFIFADSFMVTLFSEEYLASSAPFRVYLLLIPIRTVAFSALLLSLGMNMQILVRGLLGLVVNLVLNILLVRWMGSIGAAISTVLLVGVWTLPFNLFYLSRRMKTPWQKFLPLAHFGQVILQLIGFTIVMIGLAFLLSGWPHILRLVISSAIATVWMAIWWNGRIYQSSQLMARLRLNR